MPKNDDEKTLSSQSEQRLTFSPQFFQKNPIKETKIYRSTGSLIGDNPIVAGPREKEVKGKLSEAAIRSDSIPLEVFIFRRDLVDMRRGGKMPDEASLTMLNSQFRHS